MGYVGTYDRTIFYNPSNKYCIISVKTSDQSVPQQARSAYRHRDNMIRFIAVGYLYKHFFKVFHNCFYGIICHTPIPHFLDSLFYISMYDTYFQHFYPKNGNKKVQKSNVNGAMNSWLSKRSNTPP